MSMRGEGRVHDFKKKGEMLRACYGERAGYRGRMLAGTRDLGSQIQSACHQGLEAFIEDDNIELRLITKLSDLMSFPSSHSSCVMISLISPVVAVPAPTAAAATTPGA